MRKSLLVFFLLFFSILAVHAQVYVRGANDAAQAGMYLIQGKVVTVNPEKKDTIALEKASLRLVALPDSISLVNGLTGKEGGFMIFANLKRIYTKFALKVSALGMNDTIIVYDRKDALKKKSLESAAIKDFGTIVLSEKTMTLEEVKVVSELKKMFMKGDTLIYNTDAFKMPSGSVLLELVRRMPGMHYDEHGILKYGNKAISEIRLNGQSFFRDNMGIALNNMPNKELSQLKIYEASTREDSLKGNLTKRMVMDMKTKRNVTKTIFANLVAGTTDSWGKYLVNGDASVHLSSRREYSVNAGISSMPSQVTVQQATGLTMTRPMSNSSGDTRKNINVGIKESLGKDCSVTGKYEHKHDDRVTEGATAEEQFLSDNSVFNLRETRNTNKSNANSANLSIFKDFPNIATSLRANVSHSTSGNSQKSTTMSFTDNPFTGELSTDFSNLDMTNIRNRNSIESASITDKKTATMNMSIMNISKSIFGSRYSLNATFTVDESESSSISSNHLTFYNNNDITGGSIKSQLLNNPSRSMTVNATANHTYRSRWGSVNSSYLFTYSETDNERTVFQLDDTPLSMGDFAPEAFGGTEDFSMYRNSKARSLLQTIKSTLSLGGEGFSNWRCTLAAELRPEHINANTAFKESENFDKSYDFLNWTVNASVSRQMHGFSFNASYKAATSSPSLYQLLPITDNSNPLLIFKGNPDLHNKQQHTASLSISKKLLCLNLNYSKNVREIGERTTYDKETGAQERMLVNVKGGWGWNGRISDSFSYGLFTINADAGYGYRNQPRTISYGSEDIVTETRNKTIDANVGLKYGDEHWDINTSANGTWMKNESEYNNELLSPSTSSYTLNLSIKRYFGGNIDICAGYYNTWRHGSTLSMANGSDACLNFCLRYRILRGQGSLTLNAFDVFAKQRNITFTTSSTGNKVATNESQNRYVLLTFAYKLNKLW